MIDLWYQFYWTAEWWFPPLETVEIFVETLCVIL